MSRFQMPVSVTQLPKAQQSAILHVLQKAKLLDDSGSPTVFTESNISPEHKDALNIVLQSVGMEKNSPLGDPFSCAAARIAEAAAVVACATVPGGQIVIAACITAAHELANNVCS